MIPLCLSAFDLARYKRTKGTVNLHMALDHDGYPLCTNIDGTLPAVIINEQGGKEKHRERNQDCSSFYSEFAGF